MDLATRSPLLESFRRDDVPRDVRLLAARGGVASRAAEQVDLLLLLRNDPDPEVASTATRTLESARPAAVAAFLAGTEASAAARAYFEGRGLAAEPAPAPPAPEAPLVDAGPDPAEAAPADDDEATTLQRIAAMGVAQRIALAMKGTREERAILVRDPNRIVAAAVLSSPKMNDAEVASIARMSNVSEDVLRTIAMNRAWLKSYAVALGLVRNPKTPVGLSMNLLGRIGDKDLKVLTTDRNIPDALRMAARRRLVTDK